MNIVFNKKRAVIFTVISILLCILIAYLNKLFVLDGKFQTTYFILSLIFAILISPIQSFDFYIDEKKNKWYFAIISLLSILFICFIVELLNNNNMFTIYFDKLIFNFLIIGLVYLFFYCITNNMKLTLVISNILLFLLGFANYMVLMFRGTPLSLLDALSIKTGISVAFTYRINFSFYFIIAISTFLFLTSIILNFTCKYKAKNNLFRIFALLFAILLVFVFITTDVINIFRLDTNLWVPKDEYKTNGFLASIIKQSKELKMKKPEGYSLDLLQEIHNTHYLEEIKEVSTSPDEKTTTKNKPNIIVIMNESYADMKIHKDFKTNIDYMPYLKTLLNETISGKLHSSTYGGKTPNCEWEFLTNNSMAFFSYTNIPYQQFISKGAYSLVSTLKAQGYKTYAIHPWYSTGYRRNNVYQLFSFDSFDALENMEDELDFIRTYPTDLSTYKYLIKKFESKDEGENFFNFTITMQNHSGYDIPGMDSEVFLTDIENCPRVEQYLTLLKKSDEALQYLIEYFSNVDEDTIILFFGDHQPPYIEDEFWDYINEGKDPNSLADAEKGYIVPYFIWANYELPKIDVPDISFNYLSILLLDIANLRTTTYMNYLRNMQKEIPVITGHGYMTKDRSIS